jgi:hypothetical protein
MEEWTATGVYLTQHAGKNKSHGIRTKT